MDATYVLYGLSGLTLLRVCGVFSIGLQLIAIECPAAFEHNFLSEVREPLETSGWLESCLSR